MKLSSVIKKLKYTAINSKRNGYTTDDTYRELESTYYTMKVLSALSSKPNRFTKFDFFKRFQTNKIEPSQSDEFDSVVLALKPTKSDLTKARKEIIEYRNSYWIQIFNDRMIRCIGENKYNTILSKIGNNTEFLMTESQVTKFWQKMSSEDRENFIERFIR
jgi:hypothetical protein